MTPERWGQVKELLEASVGIKKEDRSTWLLEVCDDEELRREVEAFLAHEDEIETFDAQEPAVLGLLAEEPTDEEESGRLVGPYRLEELLGRGGMGAVYRARREEEFEQRVALKLVRAGIETKETVERFHTERQILARLEHPNIARLLDGGTSGGRPYFVMELIDGMPIDQYCDEHRLSVRQRVRLFLQVCDALAFAHRNLVLHLDLKPGNILVTHDGVPKLLDFGIGELLGRAQGAVEVRARRMTVSYASPEQLNGEPLSTASDLYSVGVVLYELLTGRLPCGAYAKNQTDMILAICGSPPTPPSLVVTRPVTVGFGERTKDLEPQEVAATRERSPISLKRRLKGDLDAIALRVLSKDPSDRYASVEALAGDLRRHLDDEPIEARGTHASYVTLKFIRRHRWPLAVFTGIMALVLSFTLALSNQLKHTERQRQKSAHLSDFMVGLFRAAEPDRAGDPPTVRELVDLGRHRLDTELAQEPEVRAQLLGTLGQVYYRLGFYDQALEALETSLEILQEAVGPAHADMAERLGDLGVISYTLGAYSEAEDYTRRSIAMRERLGAHADTLKPRNTLASILMLRGRLDEAADIYEDILDERRGLYGERHARVAVTLRNLGNTHYEAGRFELAEQLLQESLSIRLEHFDRESASVATALASLGRVAQARGDLEAAEDLLREALDIRRRLLGEDSLNVAILRGELAGLMVEKGELEVAGILFNHAFPPIEKHRPPGDWGRADLESVYGAYLADRGRLDEAEICLLEGRRILLEVRGTDVLPSRLAAQRLESFREQ